MSAFDGLIELRNPKLYNNIIGEVLNAFRPSAGQHDTFYVVVGEHNCGKSTMLQHYAGQLNAGRQPVLVDGDVTTKECRKSGIVYLDPAGPFLVNDGSLVVSLSALVACFTNS